MGIKKENFQMREAYHTIISFNTSVENLIKQQACYWVQIKYGQWVIGCPQIQWQKEVKFGGPINVSNFGHKNKKDKDKCPW